VCGEVRGRGSLCVLEEHPTNLDTVAKTSFACVPHTLHTLHTNLRRPEPDALLLRAEVRDQSVECLGEPGRAKRGIRLGEPLCGYQECWRFQGRRVSDKG